MRPARAAVAVCALAVLAACAPPAELARFDAGGLPTRAVVPDVPIIVQDDFHCGPAALAMVYNWAGDPITQSEVARQSFTPGAEGTFLADMIGNARRRGQLAVTLDGPDELLAELAAGHPVIVFQNLGLNWLPRWHYGVAVAYDLTRDRIVLHSGEAERLDMDFQLFARTWTRGDNWAMVVLPPDQMPALEDEIRLLRAGAALERVGQTDSAAALYAAGAERFPGSWLWQFGLGNARFAAGDVAGARRAWQRALALDPSAEAPAENLRRSAS